MFGKGLMRRDPFTPVLADPFFREVENFFGDDLFRPMLREWLESPGRRDWMPPVDLLETEEAFEVTADLPGFSKKDVEISLQDNLLMITGERKWDEKESKEDYRRLERAYGRFSRTLTLPQQVNAEKVDARFKDGVLHLTLPKMEEAKPKKVLIH